MEKQKPLKNCDPLWITHRDKNVGIMIRCPIVNCPCKNIHLTFFWAHPSRSPRVVTGDSFENLSFETLLDAKKYGCSLHGTLKNGILSWEE